jgi:LytR cell envelope-related transcriptional attenuator
VGRHSSPEATPFLRSVVAWLLPWFLIVSVVALALMVALQMIEDEPIETSAGADPPVVSTPEPQGDQEGGKERASGDGGSTEKKAEVKGKKVRRDPTKAPVAAASQNDSLGKGLFVQVLNGTGDASADDLMADKLARLKYTVVAVEEASRAYPQTTVFWVGDAKESAETLAERFKWQAAPSPGNLSTEVDLHVIVGEDAL